MEYTGCRDLTYEAVNEATEKFGDSYFLNEERYGYLDRICELVDGIVPELIEEFGCSAVTVSVDTTTKELIFDIVCDEVIFQHGSVHKFFTLMGLVDTVRFSKAEPDRLRIEIGVSGLWVRGTVYE